VLLVGVKWALLAQLLAASPVLLGIGLVLAPTWGRWTLAWMAWCYPYARPGPSLGRTVRQGLGSRQVAVATVFALAVQMVLAGFHLPALWALSGPLPGLLLARWMAGRLGGGLTGDTYGALCESVELGVLLGLAGWAG
jgi:adenosylcobinamide-GDP ribazoletransferase